MKSGCLDFVDFVDKLVSRLQDGDQYILRTNHVTWLLAQIIRVELVMNALNKDSRKVVSYMICTDKIFIISTGVSRVLLSVFIILVFLLSKVFC